MQTIYKPKKVCVQREKAWVRVQCYIRLQDMWIAEVRVRDDNRRQRWTIHSFHSFIYSHSTKQDCVLPLAKAKSVL